MGSATDFVKLGDPHYKSKAYYKGFIKPLKSQLFHHTGKEAAKVRERLAEAQNHRCAYCQRQVPLTIEHLHPKSHGGLNTFNNLVAACNRCNTLRGSILSPITFYRLLHYNSADFEELVRYIKLNNNNKFNSLIGRIRQIRLYERHHLRNQCYI